jgi:ribonuclease HII
MPKFDISQLPPAPDFSFETSLWKDGLRYVAGIDEAGRGALAGPVAAAAFIFPPDPALDQQLAGVRDSKEMTPQARYEWSGRLREIGLDWSVSFASPREIDDLGIVPATLLAIRRAIAGLRLFPHHLLVDYLKLTDFSQPQTALVKGDARCLSIAAASIMAKTSRDRLLCQMDKRYPGYGFSNNKGYGTAAHRQAIHTLGASPIHRFSFDPLRTLGDEG